MSRTRKERDQEKAQDEQKDGDAGARRRYGRLSGAGPASEFGGQVSVDETVDEIAGAVAGRLSLQQELDAAQDRALRDCRRNWTTSANGPSG